MQSCVIGSVRILTKEAKGKEKKRKEESQYSNSR